MSKREDIDGGRLIYTCNCGWVDLGHANPTRTSRPHVGALALWDQIKSESGVSSEYDDGFQVIYTQDMGKWGVTAGETGYYFVKRGLTTVKQESIALAIFQEISLKFETMQGSFPFGTFTSDSSFSQEDLVSNLIGFYRAVRPQVDYLSLCQAVSKDASKAVWDAEGSVGSVKNKNFKPVFHTCTECATAPVFPPQLQAICPAVKGTLKKGEEFRDWVSAEDDKKRIEEFVHQERIKDQFRPKY